ncbi:phytoene desaturase family protein [Streptomyces sp. NPDC050504]|uniref:phytoene desaturase family protein n=1 Tax=Streptomyces sp. NPDC050504 TaxID=3365618 RepID=UPI0037B48379
MVDADAVVVGSGPNGLAAAVTLAEAGVRVTVLEAADAIGGGCRSGEATLPGLVHDHCCAVHAMGVGSPFLGALDLSRYGLEWAWPEVDLVHPLDAGAGAPGVMRRSLAATADGLGPDGPAWRRLFGPLTEGFDALMTDLMRPLAHLPSHPLRLAGYGLRAAVPASVQLRRWRTPAARALFAGVAAHGFHPQHAPLTSAIALMLIAAGHRHGWPVARGGSQAVTDALVLALKERGGTVETGVRIDDLGQLPPCDAVLLDVAPGAAVRIAGDRMPPRVRRAYARFRHAPGAFKVDLAVEGGVPWRDAACRSAGTVHLGGSAEEVARTEREIGRGRMPERPFVLVAQQYLADPGRSRGDVHPVYAYAHVPHGYRGDATEAVLDQFERFAPGTRERVVAKAVRTTAQLPLYNANYVGGDIITGACTPFQLAVRPRPALDPYSTGIPGVYLCSAATPPGTGVHGMCGHNAAKSALRGIARASSTSRTYR